VRRRIERRSSQPGPAARVQARWLASLTLLLFILALGWRFSIQAGSAAAAEPRQITIGALLNGAEDGDRDTQAAVKLATADLNEYLAGTARVTLQVEGTGLAPADALAKLDSLSSHGVKLIVGPESSAELAALRPLIDQRGLTVISHCSTAPSLALADDGIFRLVPDDTRQATALARLMVDDGLERIVPVWRGDVFGDDLSSATRRELERLGAQTVEGIRFDPDHPNPAALTAELARRVEAAVAERGAAHVGVHLVAFGPDLPPIMDAAAGQPGLAEVRWYGSDGSVQSRELLADPGAASFARTVGFPSSLFAETPSRRGEKARAAIRAVVGFEPQVCALTAYDAVWVAGLSALVADDPAGLRRAVPRTAEHYFGVSGWTALNPAGDRDAADYDFWALADQDGSLVWQRSAHYQGASDHLVR
jgi:branched-chain amino acid transport system substrate-binding protein